MSTPNITLTATAKDLSGVAVGSAANHSRICVTLCGFGPQLPRVVGTGMIARPGPTYIESADGNFSFAIWGNDQITPAGTYYTIAMLDAQGNVVQSAAYQLGGSGTQDLSTLTPFFNPTFSTPSGYVKRLGISGALALSAAGWNAPITFDVTLTGNVSALTVDGMQRGQIVQFMVRQNATGGWAWPWPANVKNPPPINPAANSVSTSMFTADDSGNLYPANGWN